MSTTPLIVVDKRHPRRSPETVASAERMKATARYVVDDISLHRVWWRKHWVLWYDNPRAFESARPWTHRVPWVLLILPVVVAGVSWALLALSFAWILLALPLALGTVVYLGVIIQAEGRFAAWAQGNDGRSLLDRLLPPERHHPSYLSVPAAIDASRALANDARPAVEEFVRAHSLLLRGIRRYRTPGWMRLSTLTDDTTLLLDLIDAAGRFRALNEGWGSGDDWDAAFSGESSFDSEQQQQDTAAQDVLDALRAIHHSAERAPATVARARIGDSYPAKRPSMRWLGNLEGFIVLSMISICVVILLAAAGAAISGLSTLANGQNMPAGTNVGCVIESIEDMSGDKARVTTSCGAVLMPDVFIRKVAVGEGYDFEVNDLQNQGRVGIPMGLYER